MRAALVWKCFLRCACTRGPWRCQRADAVDTHAVVAEIKAGNADALMSCKPLAVQRQPMLPFLTVPMKGVSMQARQPFKLPAGAKLGDDADVIRKKKTLGARMTQCKCVARAVTAVGVARLHVQMRVRVWARCHLQALWIVCVSQSGAYGPSCNQRGRRGGRA
jgi:hypothetical protein